MWGKNTQSLFTESKYTCNWILNIHCLLTFMWDLDPWCESQAYSFTKMLTCVLWWVWLAWIWNVLVTLWFVYNKITADSYNGELFRWCGQVNALVLTGLKSILIWCTDLVRSCQWTSSLNQDVKMFQGQRRILTVYFVSIVIWRL